MCKVQVFLSTYNGEKYLKEQIESLLRQENTEVSILVRDDGSTDGTVEILRSYADRGLLRFYEGDNIGYARSFLNLVGQPVHADFYAFCDQDDVWLKDKLYVAIKQLKLKNHDVEQQPLLYASALQRVDKNLEPLAMQPFKNLKLSLGAEFTRHRLAGCSFVFNNNLRNLLKLGGEKSADYCAHDHLMTIICLICGGTIIFDTISHILFRRHGDNASNDTVSICKKIRKDIMQYSKQKKKSSDLAKYLMMIYGRYIDSKSFVLLSKISNYKNSWKNTIYLALSSEIDCGFWFYNDFVRFMILLRRF